MDIVALERRLAIMQKSEDALKKTSTADRTWKQSQNQKKLKDNGHATDFKKFGTVRETTYNNRDWQ